MKLTVEAVVAIKRLHASGLKLEAIAAQFGVSRQQVDRIVRGKQWVARVAKYESALTRKKLLDSIASERV